MRALELIADDFGFPGKSAAIIKAAKRKPIIDKKPEQLRKKYLKLAASNAAAAKAGAEKSTWFRKAYHPEVGEIAIVAVKAGRTSFPFDSSEKNEKGVHERAIKWGKLSAWIDAETKKISNKRYDAEILAAHGNGTK